MSTIYLCPNQWLFKAWHWLIRSSTPSKQFLHATLKKINANRSQISHTNTNGCTDADVLTRKSSSAKISAQLLLFQVSADPEQEHWGVTHVTHATCATLQKSRPSLSLSYFWSMNGAKMSAVLSLNLLLLKLAVWHQRKTFLLEILSIVL